MHANDRLQQRRTGYHAALKTLGVAHAAMEVEVPITAAGGAEALAVLTDRHRDIDAIFFSSDTLAVGAVQECHRRGWAVPERIAIAGYGDIDLAAQLHPPLTTVRVDRYGMGRRAVRRLLDGSRGRRRRRRSPASASRSSTGRARRSEASLSGAGGRRQRLAEGVGEGELAGVAGHLGEGHVEEGVGDADDGEAAHVGGLGLEEVELATAVDQRALVLVAVEDGDDVVGLERGGQRVALRRGPPVRRAGAARRRRCAAPGPRPRSEKASQP